MRKRERKKERGREKAERNENRHLDKESFAYFFYFPKPFNLFYIFGFTFFGFINVKKLFSAANNKE